MDKIKEFFKNVDYDKLLNGIFIGNIYSSKDFQKQLIDLGICCLNGYNEEKKCFEKCIVNGKANISLILLERDNNLVFDGYHIKSSNINKIIDVLKEDFITSKRRDYDIARL